MSGEIFQPMEESDLSLTRNPLLCYLCNEQYEDPCIFGCFHSFCAHCLRGRVIDGKMSCPVCSFVHTLKDGALLPPSDLLLKFLVESSTEEQALCANCDSATAQMFFCNTCMQPLCLKCREETHKAKMFVSHDLVLLTNRAREVHKKCSLHDEPYIMFSSEKKIMLCINCFRDMRIESRGHCLDLETAYSQSFKKLDLRVQAFRKLQNSVREGIILFKALLEEIKTNADKERTAIEELYLTLLEKLSETKALLLQKVDSQYADKETTFRSQLKFLLTLLPTLHVHLVIASAFRSSANKFEFLDFANILMERLKSIVQKQHPIHPTQSGQIDTAYKTEYFKSLEPLLYVPLQRSSLSTNPNGAHCNSPCPGSPVIHRITPNHTRRTNGLNGAKVKFIDAKGQFAEHCINFETAHRDILQRFEQMKGQCQELQRDLTMRRCLTKKDEVLALTTRIEAIQNDLDTHYTTLEQKLPLLEKHWEESLERLNNEQDLYQAQLQDVMRLKQESQHLKVITSQLCSFVSSIAAVTERLAPYLGQSNQSLEQEQQMASLLEEIHSVQPDSQQRVDAIRGAEEERQNYLANRTNPLDSELIKTKGLLKAPSLRVDRRSKKIDRESSERTESCKKDCTNISKFASFITSEYEKPPSFTAEMKNSSLAVGTADGTFFKETYCNSGRVNTENSLSCKVKVSDDRPDLVTIKTKVNVDPLVEISSDGEVLTMKYSKLLGETKISVGELAKSMASKNSSVQLEERKFIRAKDSLSKQEDLTTGTGTSKVDEGPIRNLLNDVDNFSKR